VLELSAIIQIGLEKIVTFISYAQNCEDVMLWRALKHIDKGFYVDVGANDPKTLSVTNAFYQRGWRGINIDPSTYNDLCRERIRDVNLEFFASSVEGDVVFYDVSNSALSTSDPSLAEQYRKSGESVFERKVPSKTLNQILNDYADGPIHFMNIDVEGAELAVLQGLDLSLWRPWVIMVESTIPNTRVPSFEKWERLIVSSNYELIYFDGLNRFYLASEHQELKEAFRLPPNIFDQYITSHQFNIQQELEAKEKFIKEREETFSLDLTSLNNELIAKEAAIQSFQRSLFFWLFNGPLGRFIPFRSFLIKLGIRDRFRPRLGVLIQYPSRPLKIPVRYRQEARLPEDELPVISMVTPSFNQAVFLDRTIQSILSQEYPRLEYVLQDGNSTDGSADILEKYRSQLVHVESVRDGGQAHAINLGFRHTTGQIMAYMNSDDMLLPGTLHYVARYFARHPQVDVVYGHRVIVDENDQEVGVWVLPPHDGKMLEWGDYVPQETMFWRREIWDKSGGKMDESFKFALDWDLLNRFQLAGARIVRLPRFLAVFRVHGAQKSTAQIHDIGLREMNQLRQQIHGREVRPEEINSNLRPYLMRSVIYHKLYRLGILRY
jgi:FkbM family methyltransferase